MLRMSVKNNKNALILFLNQRKFSSYSSIVCKDFGMLEKKDMKMPHLVQQVRYQILFKKQQSF
jgi:hypothetical protein